MVEAIQGLTLTEFLRLYDEEGPFELINGERVPIMAKVAGPGDVASTLMIVLGSYVRTNNLGKVYSETSFVLIDASDWVRGSRQPDVMFFSAERLSAYIAQNTDWKDKPFILVPDLAVEVVSPNDLYRDVQDKVDNYLRDGVKLVWVIDPPRGSVTVHRAGIKDLAVLSGDDPLEGGDVIPGFSVSVASLFA
jgi:Uma2 family endonuclease